ncbi:hypothetical protein [Gottfriedia acidiceleris]|uniref:hypothetical protein n=1 Tax=Gottfriedia acidiceleris TaxID=371036 RepID=UPI00101CA319|nr:hypothetical protein [Gottfriedia acidiceleris]
MILAIREEIKRATSLIGYMVLEDDWDDDRNLIFVRIYTFDNLRDDKQDALLELAETFIEFKPSVNLKVDFFVASEVIKLYEKSWENDMNRIPVYQWLIDADSENPISLAKLKIDSLNHLSQDE